MTIQQLPTYTGQIPALGQEQSEFNTNVANKLAYDAQLVPAQNTYATEANALAAGVESSAADAASSATAAASNSNFKGNWSDATGASNIPASYRNNGKNWQQLQNIADITTQEPSENSFWTELSNVTESFVQNTASRKNELSNSNFLTPSPDAITHPGPTPESYVAGTQIFSGVYAGSSGCTITLIDGRVNCTAGDYQFKVPNTGALDRVPSFVASVSGYDGAPTLTGVSYALVSSEYVVTVTPAASDVFSVKFEQGSVATKHEAGLNIRDGIYEFSTVAAMVAIGAPLGSLCRTKGYASVGDSGGAEYLIIAGNSGDNLGKHNVGANTAIISNTVVSPSMYGAKDDDVDYKLNVQSCVDSGKYVIFSSDYTVSNVQYSAYNLTLNQNGYSLLGYGLLATPDSMLEITTRSSVLYDVKVNARYLPYQQAVRQHSISPAEPSNNVNIYGLSVFYCLNGFVYGNRFGEVVVDAPQSENSIYGFKCRGVKVPFIGNQPNGFLTLHAPILDCNPYEYASQPSYDAATWNTGSLAFLNSTNNALTIVGGELLKTFTTLGYGWQGGNVRLNGVTNECACTRAMITGDVKVFGEAGGFMAGDSVELYETGAGTSGRVVIHGGQCYRGVGVAAYSGVNMIKNNGGFQFKFVDCDYTEWKPSKIGDATADLSDVKFKWEDSGEVVEVVNIRKSTRTAIPKNPLNNWTANNANEQISQGGVVNLSGAFTGGNLGVIATVKNPPAQNMTFLVSTFNGATHGLARLTISTNGDITTDTAGVQVFLNNISYT